MFHGRDVFRIFFRYAKAFYLDIFSRLFFPAESIWSKMRNKNGSRGVRGYVPSENFWKFTYRNGHFSALWTIFWQILYNFFAPNSESLTKINNAFVRTFSIMRAGVRIIVVEKIWNYEKLYLGLRKAFLKSDGGGLHFPRIRHCCLLNIDKSRLLVLTSFLQLFYLLSFTKLKGEGGFSPLSPSWLRLLPRGGWGIKPPSPFLKPNPCFHSEVS